MVSTIMLGMGCAKFGKLGNHAFMQALAPVVGDDATLRWIAAMDEPSGAYVPNQRLSRAPMH